MENNISELHEGFNLTCDWVAATMGAEGKYAILNAKPEYPPVVTKDGVSVAREVKFDNRNMFIGAYYAKQAAVKTLAKVEDATTTTLVFAKALVNGCSIKEYNSKIRDGIFKGQKRFAEELEKLGKKATKTDIYNIAKVSSNNSDRIAKLVSQAFAAVGKDGVVDVVEDRDSPKTHLEKVKGMRLPSGFKTPLLINTNKATFEASDVDVIIYDGAVGQKNVQDIERHVNRKASTVLICDQIDDEVLARIEYDKKMNGTDICVVEAPHFGEERLITLQDLATYSAGEVFGQGIDDPLHLKKGVVSRVIIDSETCTFIQEKVNEATSAKIKELRSSPKKDKRRLKYLEGKAAIIKVAGTTDIERKEEFDRVEDSVGATRSAFESGVISGGGSALVYIAGLLNDSFECKDTQRGYDMVKEALQAPFKQILSNAKVDFNQHLFKSKEQYGVGYNVVSNEVENFLETGILDAVKSVKVAMENAVGASTMMLNTTIVIK